MLEMPWEVNRSIYDLMSVDTEMYVKPSVDTDEIVGINMYKALKDIYTKVRDDKEEGLRWLDELGRMIIMGTLDPSNAKEFVHESMVEEHMRDLDTELEELGKELE
jgi:hypothetical protein